MSLPSNDAPGGIVKCAECGRDHEKFLRRGLCHACYERRRKRLHAAGRVNSPASAPDFVDQLLALRESERIAELLGSSPYMRHADLLLPPRHEYSSGGEYIRLLERFQRAPVTRISFYRFLPTLAQRRANADALTRWVAAQRRPRPGDDDRRKRALGLLNWRIYTGRNALAKTPQGGRDDETNSALRYLAPLVNENWLTRDELADAIIDASHRTGHIPSNKSTQQVERDIERAVSKFTEAFPWGRLDNDA
jgi:hypothetical protein